MTVHDDWPRVLLADVIGVQNGAAFRSDLFNEAGDGMPLVRIRDVYRGWTGLRYDGEYAESSVISAGDVLVGMDGEFRAVVWDGPQALLNQRVCRLTSVSPALREGFVHLAVQPVLDAIWCATTATTVKHLSSRELLRSHVVLPPVEVQDRIVAVMAVADRHVAAQESLVEAIRSARDQLINARLADTQTDHPVRLGDVVTLNPTALRPETAPASFRYAALADVNLDEPLEVSQLPMHSWVSAPGRARRLTAACDVLVATVGAHNRGFALVDGDTAGVVASTGFCQLRPRDPVLPHALWAVVRSAHFVAHLQRHTRGTTLAAVKAQDIADYKVPLSVLTDVAFADAVAAADASLLYAKKHLDEARQVRDELLKDILSGLHRIPESYDDLSTQDLP